MNGVVLGGTGGVWRVQRDDGVIIDTSLRGRVKKSNAGRRADGSLRRDTIAAAADTLKLAIGDRVVLEQDESSSAWTIARILPRRSKLARRAPGGGFGERVVAANVDQVVVVFAAANPEPHPRMLDRFLVIAASNDIPTLVVINKIDLVSAADVHARFAAYERAGYPLHLTSTRTGAGLAALAAALHGRVTAISGPSGAGKSSLLNAIYPGFNLRVGEISRSVNKGRHTTVGASMHPLPGPDGGFVVDTPGLREVGIWELDPRELARCFIEFRPHIDRCRFGDCLHRAEPGCAVRDAVAAGEVSADRYDSYLRLLEELERSARAW